MDKYELAMVVFALQWIILGGCSCSIMLYLIFFTPYWIIPILYYIWVFYDRDIKRSVKRRSQWYRKLSFWKNVCSYFPSKLIKTESVYDPKKNYIFGLHPHGVMVAGSYNFATEATGFSEKFPGLKPYTLIHSALLHVLLREMLIPMGCCTVSASSFKHILNQEGGGNVVVMVPGGVQEMLSTKPGNKIDLYLHKRKGFVKLALQNGASLVPVFTFGETELYTDWELSPTSVFYKIQQLVKRLTGLAIMSVSGRFGVLPLRKPIVTVVGSPINCSKIENPTQEDIDSLHEKYIESLINLFETHKEQYGGPNDKLNFIK